MIPYGKQFIDKEDIKAVIRVLKSAYLTQGPKILEFEKKLAGYCGAKYAVAVSHGTSALHLAYLAAGIKKGDEVITTPNTFVATSNMLLAIGARPVFCDIKPETYNIDETKIESLVTKKTKAIVPVHFAGHPVAMKSILKIAKKHNLKIIEDACHALGTSYLGKKVGALGSDMAVFSFHPVKSITTGEGGAVLTSDRNLYEKLLLLRSHGITKDKLGWNVMTDLGYNYRLTDIQAALGITQLHKLKVFIKKRSRIANWYQHELRDVKEIALPKSSKESAWHIYVITTMRTKDRDNLAKYLRAKGIGVNFHYPAVYSQPYYKKLGYAKARLPEMEKYHKTCLTLPLHPGLGRKDVIYICAEIRKFFSKK